MPTPEDKKECAPMAAYAALILFGHIGGKKPAKNSATTGIRGLFFQQSNPEAKVMYDLLHRGYDL